MLFYLIILLFIIGSIIAIVISHINDIEIVNIISIICLLITVVVFCFSIAPVIVTNICKEADAAKMHETYDSLYTQAYYHLYENDNDFGKKELANQITEWNEKIASYKEMKKSIWVSLCYPIDIDQFNKIPIGLLGETVG